MILLLLSFQTERDRDAFEYVFQRYKGLMLHKAYSVLRDYMLAEDALSEALLRIYRNIHKIQDPASPQAAAFVVTIVKNVALTMLKKHSREVVEEHAFEKQADEGNLEEQVVAALSSQEIYALVDGLREEYKSVFLLKYAYELSHKEIGELLDISENNVTVRLHRAKQKLQALVNSEGREAQHDNA